MNAVLFDACANNLNNFFLNRCYSVQGSAYIRSFTEIIFNYFQPTLFTAVVILLIIVLPFIFKASSRNGKHKAKSLYIVIRYTLLSLYRRVALCFSFAPWMAFLIGQRGPCLCTGLSTPSRNFPYQYTVSSVLVGMALFQYCKYSPRVLIPLATICMFGPSILYIVSGWVSIAQVLSSGLIAISLHYIYVLSPVPVIMVIDILLLIGNSTTLAFSITNKISGGYRATPSIIHGITTIIFDLYLTIRFFVQHKGAFANVTLEEVMNSKDDTFLRSTLIDADQVNDFDHMLTTDTIDGIIGFIIVIFTDTFVMLSKGLGK